MKPITEAPAQRVGRSRRVPTGFALIGALVVLALLDPPPTLAAAPTTFAEGGEGVSQIANPRGMDVDQDSGQLFLADLNNSRIDRFSASGEFELSWGIGVRTLGGSEFETCGPQASPPSAKCFAARPPTNSSTVPGAVQPIDVTVDQSSDDVYVAESRFRVQKFTADGEFLLMFGKEVDKTTGADLCTAADVAAGDECGAGLRNNAAGTTFEDAFFSTEFPVAVDSEGHVWVLDSLWLREYSEEGEFLERFALPSTFTSPGDLAVDPEGHIYVAGHVNPSLGSEEGVHEFEVTAPGALAEVTSFDSLAGIAKSIALDGAGNVYVADRPKGGPAIFRVFEHAGNQVGQFGARQLAGTGGPQGIALGDDAEALYATGSATSPTRYWAQVFALPEPGPLPESETATEVLPTEATLASTLNPEGAETTYHFEYDTAPYAEGGGPHGTSLPVSSGKLPASFEGRAVQVTLEHLTPETTYHWRLLAENTDGTFEGPDNAFRTRAVVGVEAEWATEVTATAATFHAELDPLGPQAEWWVEYGIAEGYGQSIPARILPPGFGSEAVEAHVQGLEPGTVYHWRLAARDVREGIAYTSHGADHTIRTAVTAAGFVLSDGRAWEMVSPAAKHGGVITFQFEGLGLWRAAADGSAVTYLSLGSIFPDPEGNRALEVSQVMGRHSPGGWSSADITLPHTSITNVALSEGGEYRLFSPDLATAIVEPRDTTLLSPRASERTPYIRSDVSEPATYDPLLTGREPWANVPVGTEFGGDPNVYRGEAQVRGATADFGHVVLKSEVPLVGNAPAEAIYEWSAGALAPISVLPAAEGGSIVKGVLGGAFRAEQKTEVGGAISAKGTRIFWSARSLTALYMRDMVTGTTVRLDTVQPGATGKGTAGPIFLGAAEDGGLAYFSDSEQLTADASALGTDLYACTIVEGGPGRQECRLTDLTPDGLRGAEVLGVAGMASDGSDLYFVANGVLTGDERNARGESAARGGCSTAEKSEGDATCNLYLAHQGDGSWSTRFVARISQGDGSDWGGGSGGVAARRTAQASPSGRYLVFMSQRPLTGYDNRDAAGGATDEEVFRYDSSTGGLLCVSCNASGARPHGVQMESRNGLNSQVDPSGIWSEGSSAPGERTRWLAANLSDPISMKLSYSTYQPRYVLDDGRVFYNAADDLVPGDSNGGWDVYQYEPVGTGACTPASGSAAVAVSQRGCVGLLTAGTDGQESAFVEASESGDDAFVLTAAKLSSTDVDSEYDVYDAHVCSSGWACESPPPAPAAPCDSGSSCRPRGTPPSAAGTPSTGRLSGTGNVRKGKSCAAKGRKAKGLGGRARKLRRHARAAARNGDSRAARQRNRKATQLSRRGRRERRAARQCRGRRPTSTNRKTRRLVRRNAWHDRGARP